MGTSTHNKGQNGKTPLIPSWLQEPDSNEEADMGKEPILTVESKNRFTIPRGEFTRFIKSHDLGMARRSISNYIRKTMQGSSKATLRLGSARYSSAKLLKIAGLYASGGVEEIEKEFSLSDLANKSADDVFVYIADFICPNGGSVDEGIARDAYFSAIEECPELSTIKFSDLLPEQICILLEITMTNTVFSRIINDIGNKIILLPKDDTEADALGIQIKEYIRGAISDAMVDTGIDINCLPKNQTLEIIDDVYRKTFEILADAGENK